MSAPAPAPRRHDPIAVTPARPPLTQAERTAARAAFRDRFERSAEAHDYPARRGMA